MESGIIKKGRIAVIILTITLALTILSTSILRSATVKYAYAPMVLSEKSEMEKITETISIDYVLAYPGKINPDSPFWYFKVVRDKIWSGLTFNQDKKADLNLLFADKRLMSATILFQENKPDLALATLTKAEKYLEQSAIEARDEDFYNKLALASLKHREIIENQILPLAPEDIKPEVIKSGDYSKEVYKKMRDKMLSIGLIPPQNPFD